MAYSRSGLNNALYRGTKISFVRHVNDLFMKYSIPVALFAEVGTFAEGVNIEFIVGHQYQHNRVNPYYYDSEFNNYGYGKTFLASCQKLYRPELDYCHKFQCVLEFLHIELIKAIL